MSNYFAIYCESMVVRFILQTESKLAEAEAKRKGVDLLQTEHRQGNEQKHSKLYFCYKIKIQLITHLNLMSQTHTAFIFI